MSDDERPDADAELVSHLLADLMGAFGTTVKARELATDALLAQDLGNAKRLIGEARHALGSALQILHAAIDDARALKPK